MMRSFLKIGLVAFLFCLCGPVAHSHDGPLGRKSIVKVKVEDMQVDADVLFRGDYALARRNGEPGAVFNLKELWWHDIETGTRKTLEESKTWHAASRDRSLKSLANVKDEAQRRFMQSLVDPQLKVEEKDGLLLMSNAAMSYEMRPLAKVPQDFADKLANYNTLNAYQTAIIERKVPPDAGLAVAQELARRNVYPRNTLLILRTPQKDLKFDVTMELVDLSAAEAELVNEAVAKLKK